MDLLIVCVTCADSCLSSTLLFASQLMCRLRQSLWKRREVISAQTVTPRSSENCAGGPWRLQGTNRDDSLDLLLGGLSLSSPSSSLTKMMEDGWMLSFGVCFRRLTVTSLMSGWLGRPDSQNFWMPHCALKPSRQLQQTLRSLLTVMSCQPRRRAALIQNPHLRKRLAKAPVRNRQDADGGAAEHPSRGQETGVTGNPRFKQFSASAADVK